jgi:hypothetical protein
MNASVAVGLHSSIIAQQFSPHLVVLLYQSSINVIENVDDNRDKSSTK